MKNQEYFAYDVHLDSNKNLVIAKYRFYDESGVNSYGKNCTYREYEFLDVEIPTDIEARIQELSIEGYLPINRFQDCSFDAFSKSPLINAKMMLLKFHCKELEKVYVVTDEPDHDILTFVTYINMINGQISVMKVNNYIFYTEYNIRELEYYGYVPMENSFYVSYKNQKDSNMKR